MIAVETKGFTTRQQSNINSFTSKSKNSYSLIKGLNWQHDAHANGNHSPVRNPEACPVLCKKLFISLDASRRLDKHDTYTHSSSSSYRSAWFPSWLSNLALSGEKSRWVALGKEGERVKKRALGVRRRHNRQTQRSSAQSLSTRTTVRSKDHVNRSRKRNMMAP